METASSLNGQIAAAGSSSFHDRTGQTQPIEREIARHLNLRRPPFAATTG
jgi:hypothetical protein